jgi:hypothetical protein
VKRKLHYSVDVKFFVEGIVFCGKWSLFLALLRCASKHNIWTVMLMLEFISIIRVSIRESLFLALYLTLFIFLKRLYSIYSITLQQTIYLV